MEEMTFPRVTNIVISYTVPFVIDLRKLHAHYPEIDYRPERFNGAILKRKRNCLLIFRNGKINVVGSKTVRDAYNELRELCRRMGQRCRNYSKRIVNMVGTANLNFPVNLQKLAESKQFSFNPEIYPAAYYKFGKATVSIFHTGKLVFTGFLNRREMNNAYNEVHLSIKMYLD